VRNNYGQADCACEVEKRPFYVTKDGNGKTVIPLFAKSVT